MYLFISIYIDANVPERFAGLDCVEVPAVAQHHAVYVHTSGKSRV